MRKGLLLFLLTCIFTSIGLMFWFNEWKYSLPTPVPEKYCEVKMGDFIDLKSVYSRQSEQVSQAGIFTTSCLPSKNSKPLFLHFFNPNCPCSRFNMPHFRSLVHQYGSKMDFAIVVMSKENSCTTEEIQSKFDLKIPIFFDHSIAEACGVYSTPQAVILDEQHRLFYRGNYNKSRYCTEKNSNYAQLAIVSLVEQTGESSVGNREKEATVSNLKHKQYTLNLDPQAYVAYGCKLPECKK